MHTAVCRSSSGAQCSPASQSHWWTSGVQQPCSIDNWIQLSTAAAAAKWWLAQNWWLEMRHDMARGECTQSSGTLMVVASIVQHCQQWLCVLLRPHLTTTAVFLVARPLVVAARVVWWCASILAVVWCWWLVGLVGLSVNCVVAGCPGNWMACGTQ